MCVVPENRQTNLCSLAVVLHLRLSHRRIGRKSKVGGGVPPHHVPPPWKSRRGSESGKPDLTPPSTLKADSRRHRCLRSLAVTPEKAGHWLRRVSSTLRLNPDSPERRARRPREETAGKRANKQKERGERGLRHRQQPSRSKRFVAFSREKLERLFGERESCCLQFC